MSDRQNSENYAAVHEDYALSPVPESARRGLLSMSAVMLGFTFLPPVCGPEAHWVRASGCGRICLS